MKKKFAWKKWIDPLKEIQKHNAKKISSISPFTTHISDDDEDDDFVPSSGISMFTHLGQLPMAMTDNQFVSDHIDFWIMQTSFGITQDTARIIGLVSGVESVEPLTRYSIRIGLTNSGLFDNEEVKSNIETSLVEFFHHGQNQKVADLEPELQNKVKEVRDHLDKYSNYWCLYMLPNGRMEIIKSDKKTEEFVEKVNFLITTCNKVGGKLMNSEEDGANG